MKAIGYIRVSTEEQSREGISLDMQATKIRAYCELNDLELTEIIDPDWSRLSSTSVSIHYRETGPPLGLGRRDALWCLLDAYEDLTGQGVTRTWDPYSETGTSPASIFVARCYVHLDDSLNGVSLDSALRRANQDRHASEEHPVDWSAKVAEFRHAIS